MRIFEKPNTSAGFKCPICGTGEIKPVTLVSIQGTEQDDIVQAEQVHVDCIELEYNKTYNVIGMAFAHQGDDV